MALVILTFQDQPDGTVDIKMNLEPPVPPDEVVKQSIAQQLAGVALNAVHNTMTDIAEPNRLIVVGADGMEH